jgi:hypothetical protein
MDEWQHRIATSASNRRSIMGRGVGEAARAVALIMRNIDVQESGLRGSEASWARIMDFGIDRGKSLPSRSHK